MLNRLELLIGDNINIIKNKTVLIIGLGGVGSYALESLVRSGINKVIIVDNDKVDITNLNRQLNTNLNNIGEYKVDVWETHIKSINKECEIIKVREFITPDNIDLLFNNNIDYLIDACDTIDTKKEIIKECKKRQIKFITCMGTANKMNPELLKITDLSKTEYDPIAKILRTFVKKEKINGKIKVVSSTEKPLKTNGLGSNSFVPATAGLLLTSYVINDIIGGTHEK